MSHDVTTRPQPTELSGIDGLDEVAPGGAPFKANDFFTKVWLFFISMRTGLAIILILGLLSLGGTLIPQAPEGVRADPASYDQWVADRHAILGGWAQIFKFLGLFHVFTTWYFRGLFVLLGVSILACSINRAPRLWKVATHPRTHMGDVFFSHAQLHAEATVPMSSAELTERARTVLAAHRFSVKDDPEDGTMNLYADRFRWGPFGTVVAHLSFVVILLGFALTALAGFKNTNFVAPVGEKVAVGNGTGLTVEAKSFQDTYYPSGEPKDYVADIVLYDGAKQVRRQDVRVNEPLRYKGVWFYQSSFGIAAGVTAKDASGKVLYQGSVPLQFSSDDGKYSIGSFDIPGKSLTVFVVEPASGQVLDDIKAGQAQFEVHTTDSTADPNVGIGSQGKPVTIGDVDFTYERNRTYTTLTVARDPGAWVVWLGSGLLVLGTIVVFFFPHRRVWVRIRDHADGARISVASTVKRDASFEPQFRTIVNEIQLAATPSSAAPTES